MKIAIPKINLIFKGISENNKLAVHLQKGGIKMSNTIMNMTKGAVVGLAAGIAVGFASKKMIDDNPKMRKKANKAMRTVSSLIDTAQYMMK